MIPAIVYEIFNEIAVREVSIDEALLSSAPGPLTVFSQETADLLEGYQLMIGSNRLILVNPQMTLAKPDYHTAWSRAFYEEHPTDMRVKIGEL